MSFFDSMGPTYDPVAVQPMRDELTAVGVKELLTAEAVEEAILKTEGTVLVMINSVCGCAAGNARPGVQHALQNKKIPDLSTTVFAGMEKAAVNAARGLMEGVPPSSPCIGFFKGGEFVAALQRHDIENRTAAEVSAALVGWFEEHCEAEGPSISPEDFSKLTSFQGCGSEIPLM